MRTYKMLFLCGIAAALSGCGGGGGGVEYNPSYTPGGGGGGNTGINYVSRSFDTVTNFKGSKSAVLTLASFPDKEYSNAAVNIEFKNAVVAGKIEENLKEEAPQVIRGLDPALRDAVNEELEEINAKNLRADIDAKANTTYTDLAEGADTVVKAGALSFKDITVRKMHKNSETKSVIVFSEVRNGMPIATKAKALEIDKAFGTANPFDGQGKSIGDKVRSNFGTEWGYKNGDGGKDGTTKIVIILLSSNAIGGSGYFGYFFAGDAYSKSEYKNSNEGEILYLNYDKWGADGYDLFSTIAHEFQHMCNFNQKGCHEGAFDGENEWLSINEGKSVLSEDICGFDLKQASGGNSFIYNSSAYYLADTGSYKLSSFSNYGGDYGCAYLFMKYLSDRFGSSKLNQMATSTGIGADNIENVTGVAFHTLINDFNMANNFDPLSSVPKLYMYKTLDLNANYMIRALDGSTSKKRLAAASPLSSSKMQVSGNKIKLAYAPDTGVSIKFLPGDGSDFNLSLPQVPDFVTAKLTIESTDGKTYSKTLDAK